MPDIGAKLLHHIIFHLSISKKIAIVFRNNFFFFFANLNNPSIKHTFNYFVASFPSKTYLPCSEVYSSLPPTQILERAAAAAAVAAGVRDNPEDTSADENQSPSLENNSSSSGLDVMGGLKFMLRSRSFLLRPPFHKKNSSAAAASALPPPPAIPVQSRTTPRRSRITSSDSPFR